MTLTTRQIAALCAQINHLALELATCKTRAEIRCVKQSIAAAERQLAEAAIVQK